MELGLGTILLRVGFAILLGAIVGYEREMKTKPAGFRTHMMVAGASALLLLMSDAVVNRLSQQAGGDILAADPTRVIQAIVIGISFIGSGTVLKSDEGNKIYNLTTAASILFTAGLGIVAGIGWYELGILLAALLVLILFGVGYVEERWFNRSQ